LLIFTAVDVVSVRMSVRTFVVPERHIRHLVFSEIGGPG